MHHGNMATILRSHPELAPYMPTFFLDELWAHADDLRRELKIQTTGKIHLTDEGFNTTPCHAEYVRRTTIRRLVTCKTCQAYYDRNPGIEAELTRIRQRGTP